MLTKVRIYLNSEANRPLAIPNNPPRHSRIDQ